MPSLMATSLRWRMHSDRTKSTLVLNATTRNPGNLWCARLPQLGKCFTVSILCCFPNFHVFSTLSIILIPIPYLVYVYFPQVTASFRLKLRVKLITVVKYLVKVKNVMG